MEKRDKIYKIVSILAEIEDKEGQLCNVLGMTELSIFNPAYKLADMLLDEILTEKEVEKFYDLVYMHYDKFMNILSPYPFNKFYEEFVNETST